ncbi:hypothetical protein ACOSQ3_033154 [Xanthoceras sorbifolium]
MGDFVVERSVKVGGLRCRDIKWKPPNSGCFKLNTDTGLDELSWSCYGFVCSRFGLFVLSSYS